MKINEIIREFRLKKNLTQEQKAKQLNVSTPAVNKWEKGISYPDIKILPALARLLGTDLNTLLSFKDDLSDYEIGMFVNELSENSEQLNDNELMSKAMNKIDEFPNSYTLILHIALVLDGNLNNDSNHKKIEMLYKRVLLSEDMKTRTLAQSMLIHKYINHKEYKKAEELLKELPERDFVDKRSIQVKLLVAYKKYDEAALMEEQLLLSLLNEVQANLQMLLQIAIKDKRTEDAQYIANVSEQMVGVFDLWDYTRYASLSELYVQMKDKKKAVETIILMLEALNNPCLINQSPLYSHIKQKLQSEDVGKNLKMKLIDSLMEDEETEFLRDDPELIAYINKIEKKR